jgi:hypothetical protein
MTNGVPDAPEFPIANAVQDLFERTREVIHEFPDDFAKRASIHIGSLCAAVGSAVAALETEIYLLRVHLGLPPETPFDPPFGTVRWEVPTITGDV